MDKLQVGWTYDDECGTPIEIVQYVEELGIYRHNSPRQTVYLPNGKAKYTGYDCYDLKLDTGRPPLDAHTKARQDANRALLSLLSEWVEAHPELRFGQILRAAEVVQDSADSSLEHFQHWADEFYLEPTELLQRVRKP